MCTNMYEMYRHISNFLHGFNINNEAVGAQPAAENIF